MSDATEQVKKFFEGKPVEVFRSGDYGPKGIYTDADLDELADTFSHGNYGVESHLAVDHEGKSIEGEPGPWGHAVKVWREGSSLYAEFGQVIPRFMDWLKQRPYLKPSIEIYKRGQAGPKLTLRNIAICTDQPHLKGLAPLPIFSDDRGEYVAVSAFADVMNTDGLTQVLKSDYAGKPWHFHAVSVDAFGNGSTQGPVIKDNLYREWLDANGHTHNVLNFTIQSATDDDGKVHTHALTIVTGAAETNFAESDYQPSATAEKTEKEGKKEMPTLEQMSEELGTVQKQFSELQGQVAALVGKTQELETQNSNLQTENTVLKEHLNVFAENDKARAKKATDDKADRLFGELVKAGKVVPAQKEGIVSALISFGEENMENGLFKTLMAGPRVAPPFGTSDIGEQPVFEETDNDQRVKKFMEDNPGTTYAEALRKVGEY